MQPKGLLIVSEFNKLGEEEKEAYLKEIEEKYGASFKSIYLD